MTNQALRDQLVKLAEACRPSHPEAAGVLFTLAAGVIGDPAGLHSLAKCSQEASRRFIELATLARN